ncbi:NADH-quinone oxidoreductase subunit NuoE [Robiginitomaculum antarcticum]|uniref:NADH-quinone oxidoreductase subunit NuoE n=1 Tax=Robiginitomaculum antarcticum TaxID=437507 RepID=UPI000366463F|nr:NADH-quinone oxidoreductase subunit NuoE [Robiginitomaculum antarcticum]
MSTRRLAIRQPESFTLSAAAKKEIAGWVKKYPKARQRSAMIPALWIAQKDGDGWLPEAALRAVGDLLDMAYIRVYEVATFYTMFNLAPVGVHHVQLCGTTPCWLRGSDDLIAMLKRKIGPKGSISEDGKLSWIEVECLGSCANAPMVQISNAQSDHYYEDLTADTLEAVLDKLVAGGAPGQGPQNGRHTSEPKGGTKVLTTQNLSKARGKLTKLPNAETKAKINYYEWDPKERRATRGGWVDPKLNANPDPKKRPDNAGKDMSAGLIDKPAFAAKPERASEPASKKLGDKPSEVVSDAADVPSPRKAVKTKTKTKAWKRTPVKSDAVPSKPKVLYTDGPSEGDPDDLKKIKGIGPKFEANLNASGVYYYRQIAAWKAADIKTVEDKADKFTGQIKRDEWVKQAKALSKHAAGRTKGKT